MPASIFPLSALGIQRYGIIHVPNPEASRPAMQSSRRAQPQAGSGSSGSVRIYAYEVDGMGNHLADFDDPNLPSLLAMPLLGYSGYDEQVYRATRDRWGGHCCTGQELPHAP
jgi:hypothetical protein